MNSYKRNSTRADGCGTLKKRECNKLVENCVSESFQQQALEIREPGENFDPTAEPQSGEEFLMRMLYERKSCPAVVAKRPKKLQKLSDITDNTVPNQMSEKQENSDTVPSSLRPTPEWVTLQCVDFLTMREKINRIRLELEIQNYTNELEPPFISDTAKWLKFCQKHPPLLSIMMRINQRNLEQLLEMLCEWLRMGADSERLVSNEETEQMEEVPDCKSNIECNDEIDSTSELKPEQLESAQAIHDAKSVKSKDCNEVPFDLSTNQDWLGSWIYATLACLHLPIEPNVHSTLREIARLCIRLRNGLSDDSDFKKAAPYNLFISLISKVFDQLDFAQFV